MTKKRKDESVGPWAREKLNALREYLGYYTKVLKNQRHWCKSTIYVDAFAGAGSAPIRKKNKPVHDADLFSGEPSVPTDSEAVEFVDGSPLVALDIADPFSRYLFIESDPKRVAKLETLRDKRENPQSIEIKEGDANDQLLALLQSGLDWRTARAVVFLDPFGMHVPWATIEALAKTRGIEVLINFPMGMAIQRLLARTGEITPSRRAALDAFFGSPDWYQHAYESGQDLFGPKTLKLRDSGERLLEWYRSRLRGVFGHVSSARLIRNTKGGHLYYLIWAGPHKAGLKGAEYILNKGEKVKVRS
jgi:three-Cys-motif partner protein